jgi:hypothetical protein
MYTSPISVQVIKQEEGTLMVPSNAMWVFWKCWFLQEGRGGSMWQRIVDPRQVTLASLC